MTLRAFLPTDAWVRWLLVPAVAFIALAGNTSYLADFWHHLARGRAIIEGGRLLDHDIFTCTVAGQPFQDVNWLSQIVYYHLFELGGLALVRVVNAAIVALTLFWLVALCKRVSDSLPVSLGIGIAVFLGLWDVLTIRPQTFSLLLFVAMYDVLGRSERRPGLLVVPPLLMALWANLHGAFPAGLMLLGCWWLAALWVALAERTATHCRRARRLGLCLAAAILATLANPYGWGIYLYVAQTSNLAAARGIDEWLRPEFNQLIGLAYFVSLPIVVGLVVVAWKKKTALPTVRELLLVCCFLPLACGSVRMVAWWLLAMAPFLARRIALLWPATDNSTTLKPNRGASISVVALGLAMVFSLPGLQRFNPLMRLRPIDPTTAQVHDAQEFLAGHLDAGRVFSRFEWGEYVSWAGHPRLKVFLDGRIEIYPDAVWQAYADVTCGQPNWQAVLDDYHIDALLLDVNYHRWTGLLPQVEQSPHWQRRHQVGNAVVFVRGEALAQK